MLKRFLKFLKGSEEEGLPDYDGSYLDFLLEQTRPGVEAELEVCPEHDPLLLVIAEILRVSMADVWSDTLRRPLIDQHSPLKRTTSTPPPPPDPDAPNTEELDADELEEIEDEFDIVSETPQDTTDEYDVAELREESSEAQNGDFGEDGLPRVDTREVLQAGRVFLGMLIENDRLPVDLQLGIEETGLARDLLVGYFVGHQNFEAKAQKLLRVVEQKFSEGQFSQARILLQLFQTDRDTRIRNDRNIFYEDMIQRLGIRRRHPVSTTLLDAFEGLARPAEDKLDAPPYELMSWLSEHLFVRMHLFVRDEAHVEVWSKLGDASSLPGASENLLRFLPPRRWRPLHEQTAPMQGLVRLHINTDSLATYIINHVRTCYFVLRAVGDTGLEGFLDSFFDWCEAHFEFNATLLFPELYRRSMADVDMMQGIFQELYARHFKVVAEEKLADLDVEALMEGAIARIRRCNVNDIPPGNYDFGGFVFDELFQVEYPTAEFAFKVHRLT